MSHANTSAQPAPSGEGRPVLVELMSDLLLRREHGVKKYGVELKADNGRDALADAYQEAIDLVMYLKQSLMERDTTKMKPLALFTDHEFAMLEASIERKLDDIIAQSVRVEYNALHKKIRELR